MARSVCIKVGGVTLCTGSPIKDCSCDRNVAFKDPYPETPEGVDDPKRALADISSVVEQWSRSAGASGRVDKLYAISAITRLILSPGVDLAGPFVIMSLENGDEPAAKAG
jgi:hypothetical protein